MTAEAGLQAQREQQDGRRGRRAARRAVTGSVNGAIDSTSAASSPTVSASRSSAPRPPAATACACCRVECGERRILGRRSGRSTSAGAGPDAPSRRASSASRARPPRARHVARRDRRGGRRTRSWLGRPRAASRRRARPPAPGPGRGCRRARRRACPRRQRQLLVVVVLRLLLERRPAPGVGQRRAARPTGDARGRRRRSPRRARRGRSTTLSAPCARVDVEAEARLARPLLDDEEPARVLRAPRRCPPPARVLGGQVEAEEVDVGIDLRLVERRRDLLSAGCACSAGRSGDQRPLLRSVDRAVRRCAPTRARCA